MLFTILLITQCCFSAVTCFYFYQTARAQRQDQPRLRAESKRELEKLHSMNRVQLTVPLSEKVRPTSFAEICGQSEGKRALGAALCGENPQHVIIYGPPGVGKTAAARAALMEAKKNPASPFGKDAQFIEMDATTLRYDERGIADPLIGSVHDPIYQGAGAYGAGGIPQPKAGAVTKAHGGILFLDEIGELPPMQLNRLLKVLEDRRVYFESAYYSRENKEIPGHIHEIFKNGLPADFRLVGATTRLPEELPPALRSRCTEIFFDALSKPEICTIAACSAEKSGFGTEADAVKTVSDYARSGRDAVNMMQTAGSLAKSEGRASITAADIMWVAGAGRYAPAYAPHFTGEKKIGTASALAVAGPGCGTVLPIEVIAVRREGRGSLSVTGAAETECISVGARQLSRRSTAVCAVENAIRFLETVTDFNAEDYSITVSFPGGTMADGPSAGLALLAAIYSAVKNEPVEDNRAFVGEISPRGAVLPVGGMQEKMRAAKEAGIQTVYMPKENAAHLAENGIEIVPITDGKAFLSLFS